MMNGKVLLTFQIEQKEFKMSDAEERKKISEDAAREGNIQA